MRASAFWQTPVPSAGSWLALLLVDFISIDTFMRSPNTELSLHAEILSNQVKVLNSCSTKNSSQHWAKEGTELVREGEETRKEGAWWCQFLSGSASGVGEEAWRSSTPQRVGAGNNRGGKSHDDGDGEMHLDDCSERIEA